MTIKTIKDVDEETWYKFKQLSVKNRVTMGKLMRTMVDTYEQQSSAIWKEILHGKKRLSDNDANELEKTLKTLRKEHGFRI